MSRMSRLNRSGSAVVIVVIIIAVLALVGVVNYMKVERFPEAENVASSYDKFPWQEHARIVEAGEEINTDYGKGMVDISDGLAFEITVEGTQHANQMSLMVKSDGTLAGGWSSDFKQNDGVKNMNYDMKSSFKGNIDPSCIYFDAEGEDYSKLFITARGNVSIVAINNKTNKTGMASRDIFVSGWIDKEGKAKGNLGMFLDDGEYEIYQWKSTN